MQFKDSTQKCMKWKFTNRMTCLEAAFLPDECFQITTGNKRVNCSSCSHGALTSICLLSPPVQIKCHKNLFLVLKKITLVLHPTQKQQQNTLTNSHSFCALVEELKGITFTQGSLSHVANTVSSLQRWGQIKYKTNGKQVLQLHVGWAGQQHNANSKFFSICIIITISSDLW